MTNKAWVAAALTVLVGGAAPPAARLALVTAGGRVPVDELKAGGAGEAGGWRAAQPGLKWTELELQGRGEARRIKVIAVRLDPDSFTLSLENGVAPGGYAHVWTLDMAPKDAALALNAGMFEGQGVWGWVVHAGKEYRAPRLGPLARAVIIDSAGSVRLTDDAGVAARRETGLAGIKEAFQSYPALLDRGELPPLLSQSTEDLDIAQRDARLALGIDHEGHVIIVLTRFDALGPAFGSIPFGLTIPETALLMRSLGAESAVALDGGISAQMMLRDGNGTREWKGLRPVPLGLSAVRK